MPGQDGDMAARSPYIPALIASAALASAALAQVGPPVGGVSGDAFVLATPDGAVVEPAATEAAPVIPSRAARPDESTMPLMAPARSSEPPGGTSASSGGWVRSLASVALVVGLILVLAAVARFVSRRNGSVAAMIGPGGRAPSGVLEVLARYPVGRGQVLVLLRVDRRVLLLSQSVGGKGAGFATLAQFDEPGEVAAILQQTRDEAGESISARFRQALDRFQGEVDDAGVERGEIIEVGARGEPLAKGRGLWA